MAMETGGLAQASLEAAVAAGRWIVSSGQEAGRTDPPQEEGRRANLYSGTAGTLLYLQRLAALTGEPWAKAAAATAAGELLDLADRPQVVPSAGLYSGLAGIAFALGKSKDSVPAAHLLIDELITRRPSAEDCTDIISGSAGYGLTLLWAAAELGRDDALATATAVGDQLLGVGEPVDGAPGGRRWRMRPADEFVMPNFSHGTAGVAFFLASLAEVTGQDRFLEAARAGARHLTEIADQYGTGRLICHHSPGGDKLHYLGWCHGPPGTARLFLQLQRTDPGWGAEADALASGLLATGIPDTRTDGFWNNVGRCCGDAGVAEFAQDLIDAGRDPDGRLAHLRDACTANVLQAAVPVETPLGAGASWPHAEHRNRPEQIEAAPGLMQGASGIGLWLLRHAGMEPLRLPDDVNYRP
jgi:lantibiotic modifying enzyme